MITIPLIGFPALLALILLFQESQKLIRVIALAGSLLQLAWALFAWINYLWYCRCSLRFEAYWLESIGFSGTFGMNASAMAVILSITVLLPLFILFTWKRPFQRLSLIYGGMLLAETLVILVVTAVAG
ncbi:MAG: hypothetical protein JXA23_04450 [Bacteroidales bacterium]|nr:hypothetical protein [Bacteroidales bacterium]